MKITITFLFIVGFYLYSTVKLQASEPVPANWSPQDAVEEENEKGVCECAVFGVDVLTPDDKSVITIPTNDVQCNEEGKERCGDLCRFIARSAHENASTTLCDTLGDLDKLRPSIFSKVCNESDYTFTGLTSPKTYCCERGKPTVCE